MEFVCNANFKGDFEKNMDLCQLHQSIPNSKLCKKPYQLIIKDLQGTLILFSNGKFRTMGCIDELEASFLAYSYADKISASFPPITLQSYMLRAHLGFPVNLAKLAPNVDCVYEPELFPALRLKAYKPMSVNIFCTGKVVVCGIRDPEQMYLILLCLRLMCEPYEIRL